MNTLLHPSKNLLFLLLLACGFSAQAQWTEVGSFNGYINDLKSFDGQLWIGGYFTKVNGETSYGSASYNGSNYGLDPQFYGNTGILGLEVFNDQLFEAGTMTSTHLGSWSGFNWTAEAAFEIGYKLSGIYADGNDLYVGSTSGDFYKRTGAGPLIPLTAFSHFDNLSCITKFNDQIIVGGYINNSTYRNIAAWNGTYWMPLGTGFDLPSTVYSLAVYKNELYAAGTFNTAGGQSSVAIAKWNGTTWADVGGSVTGTEANPVVWDLKVIDDRLYAAGNFSEIGGVATKDVAYWDGNSWTGLNFTESIDFPKCIESYNGHLYIGTYSLTAPCKLFRFDGTVATHSPEQTLQFTCSPNPAASQCRIALTGADQNAIHLTLRISDAAGRLILEDRSFLTDATYNCQSWAAGRYQVTLLNSAGKQLGSQQLIKE